MPLNTIFKVRDDWSIYVKAKAYEVQRQENRQTNMPFLESNKIDMGPPLN